MAYYNTPHLFPIKFTFSILADYPSDSKALGIFTV